MGCYNAHRPRPSSELGHICLQDYDLPCQKLSRLRQMQSNIGPKYGKGRCYETSAILVEKQNSFFVLNSNSSQLQLELYSVTGKQPPPICGKTKYAKQKPFPQSFQRQRNILIQTFFNATQLSLKIVFMRRGSKAVFKTRRAIMEFKNKDVCRHLHFGAH